MNRYGYAFNNPLSFTDPSGWWPNGYQHKDPPEDYNEPYSYAPTGGGDVYYRLNRWYNGPSDPFAGMGFDFEGKMHDAYINTINARPPEAGPSRQLVDLYFESGAAEEGVSYVFKPPINRTINFSTSIITIFLHNIAPARNDRR